MANIEKINQQEAAQTAKNRVMIKKVANRVLTTLWVGTVVLILFMMFRWQESNSFFINNKHFINPKILFIDDMLLSAKDLELDKTTSLINITLNEIDNNSKEAPSLKIRQVREAFYDEILKQKIKKAQHADYTDGFAIKPLPN